MNANPTGGYNEMQLVVLGVVVLAISITLILSLLAVPPAYLGTIFVVLVVGLMVLAWPLFVKAHPREETATSD
ncbi:hypothetical protein ACT4ML_09410 [Natrinema sp. LN54]|uniref:hypothetical protein n=1 Tax=Natrinema sp. LN54 TaxID=3458705 RepID=UPI0040350650